MMLLGFRARYGGRFGDVPVIECGKFKLIQVKDYASVPLPLMYLLLRAKNVNADFLVIDPDAPLMEQKDEANWIDTRQGDVAA